MKKILPILFLSFSVVAVAQPVIINGNSIPAPGFSAAVSLGTPLAGTGSAGANQVWDFSGVLFNSPGSMNVIVPSASPIGGSFPSATYAYSFVNTYSFFKVSGTKMEVQAYTITVPGSGDDFTPNPRTVLKFPFIYLDSEVDSWQKTGGGVNNVTLTYDGYGILKTPTNTYHNVVRIKEDYGSGIVDFQWYITNPLMSVMTYSKNSNTLFYTNVSTTGVPEQGIASQAYSIFPNPAKEKLEIQFTDEAAVTGSSITIINSIGQTVKEISLSEINTSVDLNLNRGIYFYVMNNSNGIIGSGKLLID